MDHVTITVSYHNSEKSLPFAAIEELKEMMEAEDISIEDDGTATDASFQLFQYQILSLYDNLTQNYLLIDCHGREVHNILEIYDLYDELLAPTSAATSSSSSPLNIIRLWIYDELFLSQIASTCSSLLFPAEDILQPYHRLVDTNFEICSNCSNLFDSNLLTTSIHALHQYQCLSKDAINFGLSLTSAGVTSNDHLQGYNIQINNMIGKYLRRKFLYQALHLQPQYQNILQPSNEELQFEARFQSYLQTIQAYENPSYQATARDYVDYDIIAQYIQEYEATDPNMPKDLLFLRGLVKWFKKSFFKWCNRPPCTTPSCDMNNKPADSLGMGNPTEEERTIHWAGRVEIYRCTRCQSTIRFPRINNPRSLLDSKRGRCGEWANCFAFICRSLGLDVRWVIDFTDHVWVEVWCDSLGRFIHIDPCEMAIDTPLLYEVGWKKKLSYLFSFSRYGVCDSTPRYSRLLNGNTLEFRQRRSEVTETLVSNLVKKFDERLERDYLQQLNSMRRRTRAGGILEMSHYRDAVMGGKGAIERLIFGGEPGGYLSDLSMEIMKERKRKEKRELMKFEMMREGEDELREEEKKGRQSGDRQWREQRGEIGGEEKDGGGSEQEVLVGSLKERYQWMENHSEDHLCYFSPYASAIELFVSSITMSDPLDNSRNGYLSNLNNLHTLESEGGASCGGGVFATHAMMVNGLPVCRAGRGHNVAIFSLETGELIGSHSFDTHASDGFEMIQFLLPYIDTTGTSHHSVFCRERYLILINVIDSGEHLSDSGVQFLTRLATVSNTFSSFQTSSSSLHSSYTAPLTDTTMTEQSLHHPGHRQSYVLCAVTCPGAGSGQEILWSHADLVPSGRGPLCCRMNISFDLETDKPQEGTDLLQRRGVRYQRMIHLKEKDGGYSFNSSFPLCRSEMASEKEEFEVFHERMSQLCEHWERLTRDVVFLVYQRETGTGTGTGNAEKLFGYIYSISNITSLQLLSSPEAAKDSFQDVYLKCVTPLTSAEGGVNPSLVSVPPTLPAMNLLKYIPLGGQHHPDTVTFDTTAPLLQLANYLSCYSLNEISLTEISFYGGRVSLSTLPVPLPHFTPHCSRRILLLWLP
jgi:hypothetical protein